MSSQRPMRRYVLKESAQPTGTGTQPSPARPQGARTLLCESIISQLLHGYECMVCVDNINRRAAVWSCRNCYKIFHLPCIRRWAKAGKFRCPACQIEHDTPPSVYTCFCGKARDPKDDPYLTPHSCGDLCLRIRPGTKCTHPCQQPCHPGPCPMCSLPRTIQCHCGCETKTVACSSSEFSFACAAVCNRKLSCGRHVCQSTCHEGPCKDCDVMLSRSCFCGRNDRTMPCKDIHLRMNKDGTEDTSPTWSCGTVCDKLLDCGNHRCQKPCHLGPCEPCSRVPARVQRCCCGKSPLAIMANAPARSSCLDPLPICGQVCGKRLSCGVSGHTCSLRCHEGPCEPCKQTMSVYCRCGSTQELVPCLVVCQHRQSGASEPAPYTGADGKTYVYPLRCQRRCGANKHCGRHRCELTCCPHRKDPTSAKHKKSPPLTDLDHLPEPTEAPDLHVCTLRCNRKLDCGSHLCEAPCHKGLCGPCMHIITTELQCACGNTVLEPPQPCSTPPPRCPLPCCKVRPCGHPAEDHPCHFGDCPSCAVLVNKLCAGGHTMMENVLCHLKTMSCGGVCGKVLGCGQHTCPTRCHPGPCPMPGASSSSSSSSNQKNAAGTSATTTPVTRKNRRAVARAAAAAAAAAASSSSSGDPTEEAEDTNEASTSVAVPAAPTSCGQTCGALLPCQHRCTQKCHVGSPCPTTNCKQTVPIRCDCGRKTEEIPCQKYQQQLREIGGKHGKKTLDDLPKLTCDAECAGSKRLQGLAEAFGFASRGADGGGGAFGSSSTPNEPSRSLDPFLWSVSVYRLGKSHMSEVPPLEAMLNDFVKSDKTSLMTPSMSRERRMLLHEMAPAYGLNTQSFDREPQRTVYLTKTPGTKIPHPLLSTALRDPAADPVEQAKARLEKYPGSGLVFEQLPYGTTETQIESYMKQTAGRYVLVWIDPSTCVAVFANAQLREDSMLALKTARCPFVNKPFSATLFRRAYEALYPTQKVRGPREGGYSGEGGRGGPSHPAIKPSQAGPVQAPAPTSVKTPNPFAALRGGK